ncbi:hypothetical protein [Litchfieldia alkalitelluris]|uniref:hypothetical protein n=1 Tax=Litchfieldia alkalitelluris TaxID=304268 RepID=UPI0009977172|nr:hypothetical protein [Litchfieldia alkalitelluris]
MFKLEDDEHEELDDNDDDDDFGDLFTNEAYSKTLDVISYSCVSYPPAFLFYVLLDVLGINSWLY